jgi:hypothetical protein
MNLQHLLLIPALFLLLFGWLFIPVHLDNPFSMAFIAMHTIVYLALRSSWSGPVP